MIETNLTDRGYQFLKRSGIARRIDKKWRELYDVLPLTAIMEVEEVQDAIKESIYPDRKREMEKLIENEPIFVNNERFFMISGQATDAILDKDEIINRGQLFGIYSLNELDYLIASYAIEKQRDGFGDGVCILRSSGLKTRVRGDMHGDLQIHQTVTEKISPQTDLEGRHIKPFFGKLDHFHIDASYEYWPVFAATLLKYSDYMGIELPASENWEKIMKGYGWNSEIVYSHAVSGEVGYADFSEDYENAVFAELPDKLSSRGIKKMFFGIMRPNADHTTNYVPVINEEEDLRFYVHHEGSKKGRNSIRMSAFFGEKKIYNPSVLIPKKDCGKILECTVHGIMNHGSRTRPEFLAYLFWQHDRLKEGMKSEEIDDVGRKTFDRQYTQ